MIRKPVSALVVLAASALAAGCGASSSSNASPAAATTTRSTSGQPAAAGPGRALPAAFTTCLKQHGVSLPAGGFRRAPGANGARQAGAPPANRPAETPVQAKRRAAFAACRKFAPQGFGARFGRRGVGQFAGYTACMRKQGIAFGGAGATVDLTSAKFKAAAKKCRSLLPANGAGAAVPGGSGQ